MRAAGASTSPSCPQDQIAAAHELIYRPLRNPDGPPQPQVEYKLRRFVNDYVAPPEDRDASSAIAVETFERMAAEVAAMGARTPHELMRCAEVAFIRDCARWRPRPLWCAPRAAGGFTTSAPTFPQRTTGVASPPQPA